MPPKLLSDDGRHVVIRPLAYCSEDDIGRYARLREFPLIPCNLCGSQPNLQRQAIKEMLHPSWPITNCSTFAGSAPQATRPRLTGSSPEPVAAGFPTIAGPPGPTAHKGDSWTVENSSRLPAWPAPPAC